MEEISLWKIPPLFESLEPESGPSVFTSDRRGYCLVYYLKTASVYLKGKINLEKKMVVL